MSDSTPHKGQFSRFIETSFYLAGNLLYLLFVWVALASCTVVSDVPEISKAEIQREEQRQLEFAERTIVERTQKLADLSWPILAKNLEMCGEFVRYRTGLWLARESTSLPSLSWLPDDEYTFGNDSSVWGVAKGSPAADAGFQSGDQILSIDSLQIKSSKVAHRTLAKLIKEFNKDRSEPIKFRVLRTGKSIELEVHPVLACRSEIALEGGTRINAYATGENIKIFNGIFAFAESDEELQFVIAHELAHNMSNHIAHARVRGAIGVVFDLLALRWRVWTNGSLGRLSVKAYSKPYEIEADYLALYLLANADIDSTGVENLWRRLATEDMARIGWILTHPSTPERYVQLQKTREEIEDKQRKKEELLPERK